MRFRRFLLPLLFRRFGDIPQRVFGRGFLRFLLGLLLFFAALGFLFLLLRPHRIVGEIALDDFRAADVFGDAAAAREQDLSHRLFRFGRAPIGDTWNFLSREVPRAPRVLANDGACRVFRFLEIALVEHLLRQADLLVLVTDRSPARFLPQLVDDSARPVFTRSGGQSLLPHPVHERDLRRSGLHRLLRHTRAKGPP